MTSKEKLTVTSNKNVILRCRDRKRTETRIGMEGICITHSCIRDIRDRGSGLYVGMRVVEMF